MEYPKWLYHRELKPRVVADVDEHARLGDGWEDTPAAFDEPEQLAADAEEQAEPAPKKKARKGK